MAVSVAAESQSKLLEEVTKAASELEASMVLSASMVEEGAAVSEAWKPGKKLGE